MGLHVEADGQKKRLCQNPVVKRALEICDRYQGLTKKGVLGHDSREVDRKR